MIIGHVAVALAAKRVTPGVSLAMLLVAAQWADIVWRIFLGLGLESVAIDPGNTAFTPLAFVSIPYSHSLAMLIAWGVVVGGVYRGIAGGRRTVWVLSALVVSHWVLDVVTDRPDMPLYPGGPTFGLGLWNWVPATLAIELAMYAAGVWIYLRCTRARDRVGRWGFLSLAGFLLVAYGANGLSGAPPSVTAISVGASMGAVVMVAWAWWADRHREYVG